jgi:glutaredoxin 3
MVQRPRIRLYVSRWCAQCERAAALLERHGLSYETIDVGAPEGCCRLHELTGGASVPQAVIDGRPVGGYEELAALLRAGFPDSTDPAVTAGRTSTPAENLIEKALFPGLFP